jgi:hypothetical protein
MIITRFAMLRIWDVLFYEGNRSILFKTKLALMEIHGRVNMLMFEHLR